MEDDGCRISPGPFETFVNALLTAHRGTSHAIRLALSEGFTATAALGARVIGTASEGNHDFLRPLGAEPVTYRGDFAERVRALAPDALDAVLDAAGKRTRRASPGLLRAGGRLASVADPQDKASGGDYVFARPGSGDLAELGRMAEAGLVRVEIAQAFPLEKAAEAQQLVREGHTRGKLVVVAD